MSASKNNALELAFKKAVEEGTNKDKNSIKERMFGKNVTLEMRLLPDFPIEKIKTAVEKGRAERESKKTV